MFTSPVPVAVPPSVFIAQAPCMDMGNQPSMAWQVGKVPNPFSVIWKNGCITQGEGSGINVLENIGGEDVSDYLTFILQQKATVTLKTQRAIVQLLNGKANRVIVDSSDSYTSTLTTTLRPGQYYVGFSSESSTVTPFRAKITFQ